jgi:PKD repeat protein
MNVGVMEAAGDSARAEKSPSDFDEKNVYYLWSPKMTTDKRDLKGIPPYYRHPDPVFNKYELNNGQPVYFTYPGAGERKAKLEYSQSFLSDPFIHLVLNSYETSNKLVNVELGVDTDNDNDFELVCDFPSYTTISDISDGTMEEEVYEAYGTWQGGKPPAFIEGWLVLKITMTSPNGNPGLLYCGFDNKTSWIAVPYMHTDLEPRAKINASHWDTMKRFYTGDTIQFDGSDSYSPYDDLNGNNRIDGFEIDRLQYYWDFDDGNRENFDYANRKISHVYSNDAIPKKDEFSIFNITLVVMDKNQQSDSDNISVKIYRNNHSPVIKYLKVNNVEQLTMCSVDPPVIVPDTEVYFSAYVTDEDNDKLFYYWDFNGDSIGDINGSTTNNIAVSYIFSSYDYDLGVIAINLRVSDGTLATDASINCKINLKENLAPMAKIKARRKSEPIVHHDSISVNLNEPIIFDASDSHDPDHLPGFDIDNDGKKDYDLRYRWIFNSRAPSITSGWIFEKTFEYSYTSAGDNKFFVTLDVDDGISWTTSKAFVVNINTRPNARISIDKDSYNRYGNLELGRTIHFNGTESTDPNNDMIVDYLWKFGDGNYSTAQNPNHTYSNVGTYVITLSVSDGELQSKDDKIIIEILPKPVCRISGKYSIYPLEAYSYEPVQFDASGLRSFDSEDEKLNIIWFFGDNTTSTSINAIHAYTKAGDYPVILEISNSKGAKLVKREYIIHILNRKPIADIKVPSVVPQNEPVWISAEGSLDPDGTIVRYLWDFGDGTNSVWINESLVQHEWKNKAIYTVTLMVMDDAGAVNETQIQIEVGEVDTKSDGAAPMGLIQQIFFGIMAIILLFLALKLMVTYIRSQNMIRQD